MPKSSRAELSALREEVFTRDGGCVWPGHTDRGDYLADQLQLVHLAHRGMGGRASVNTPENCVTLCAAHHWIFDGRDGSSNTKRELALMLRTVAGL